MSKILTTFPVTKNGEFIGYADAAQIAAHPSLELFDESKAASIKASREVKAAKEEAAQKTAAGDDSQKAGGADASAVKKGPPTK